MSTLTRAQPGAAVPSRLLSVPLAATFLVEFTSLTSFFLLLSVMPMLAAAAGSGTADAGLLTGALLLGTVAAEVTAAALINRFGCRIVITTGAVLLGAPALALSDWPAPLAAALARETQAVMVSVSLVRGLGFGLCTVATGALTAKLLPPDRRGEGLGLLGLVSGVPAIVALPAGVWLAGHHLAAAAAAMAATAGLLPLAAVRWLPGRREPSHNAHTERTQDAPRRERMQDAPRHDQTQDAPRHGRLGDASRRGQTQDAPSCGRIEDASRRGPMQDASRRGRLEDPPRRGWMRDASGRGWMQDAPRRGRTRDASRHGQVEDAPRRGRIEDASRRGPMQDASRRGRLEDASKHGRMPAASRPGRVEDAPRHGRMQDAPSCGRMEDAPRRGQTQGAFRRGRIAGPAVRLPLIFAAATIASGVLDSFLPLAKGVPSNLSSAALFVQAIVATLSRWQAGKRGDRYGHARLLISALPVAALGMAAMALLGSPAMIFTSMVLFGAGFGVIENATLALLIERLPEAKASALWNLAYDAGYGAGPAAFGPLCARTGSPAAFALTGVLILAAVPLALRERRFELTTGLGRPHYWAGSTTTTATPAPSR